ncbi:hypothetical protein NOCA240056 [metagenome]|uniref:Apea-like HEPN domain-containing protein n=1 Tax=metagenome TaxID=256318 RepID=A0A2P2C5Q8_9ZZZZ
MVTFTGVYELPHSIAVTPSCLSKSFRSRIAGRSMVLKTPAFVWGTDDRPHLVAPHVDHLPTQRGQGVGTLWEHGAPWGAINSCNPSKRTFETAWVNAVALKFALPAGSFGYLDAINRLGPPHGGSVAELFRNIDSWFLELLVWVGVSHDLDTDHLQPLAYGETPGEGLTIRSIESDGTLSSLMSASETRIYMARHQGVKLGTLRTLVKLVNDSTQPHDSHLLLREAHLARRRGRLRRAVIDAGTATELALAEWNVRSNGNKQPPRGRFATLGWYVIEAKAVVPTNTMADLVNRRNDAVHKNLTPTPAQAIEAVRLAETIVHGLEPLPL